eukprot:Phypoly_transcript_00503.p1 GENE.Phypoly_transcript_00503~~Phypoly_transcript_00503.p1  ORF type:complete len:987 (+),score=177.48 Phypoly_transcript_00503:142-3102(+)
MMDDPFSSCAIFEAHIFPKGINLSHVLEFFKSGNAEENQKIRWDLVKHCITLAHSDLASAFRGLISVIPFLSTNESKKFLRVCANRQVKYKAIEYSAFLCAFLKHLPTPSLYHLVTALDIAPEHRSFVLRFLSYQPYHADMIQFVPCADLPRYFSILQSQISAGDFIRKLDADQIVQIVRQMHLESQRDDLDYREWHPLEAALCQHVTKNSWWNDVTARQLRSAQFPSAENLENREEFENAEFWFAKKLLISGDQTEVLTRLWQDKECFDDFLRTVTRDPSDLDFVELLIQLELRIQDTQCAIAHVLDWAKRITASCSPAQAMRITQFVAHLQASVANRIHVINIDLHVHACDAREEAEKSILGKRVHTVANSGNDDEFSMISKAARNRLSGADLESLLNSLVNVTSTETSATEPELAQLITFLIRVLEDLSANLLLHPVTTDLHQLLKAIFPLLTRTLPAAVHNAGLRDFYHIRRSSASRSYSEVPLVLITSVELLSFLIGTEPQTCDVIANFAHRFLEVSAQDPARIGDAARFEQFTQLLIWVWERYNDLLGKYAALLRAARATGATQKPAFSDAIVNFILQMISKPQATQDYFPGTTILHAPAASPMRTSAQSSPTQSEPVYAAHHAPYVLRALLARRTEEGAAQLDARLLTSLVTASRLDITKWKCFKVINFLLEEVPEVASGILLGKGESEGEQKGSEKREQMKGLIGCVVAHLKPDSSYRPLSGVAFATLGSLVCDPPTLHLLLALQSLPANLFSILPNSPANHINARLNASTALQLLISEGAENATVSQRLAAFCDRHNLANTLLDLIIANNEEEQTKGKEAQVCANLLDSLSVMVVKIPGQANKIFGRANDLLNYCGNKTILYNIQNEASDSIRFICAIFVALLRGGWQELAGVANIAALEFDFLVSNCPGLNFIESALELLEEIVTIGGKEALAIFNNLQMHLKIKSLLAAQHKNLTKSVGTRLVAMGRQITTKGLT